MPKNNKILLLKIWASISLLAGGGFYLDLVGTELIWEVSRIFQNSKHQLQ
jgi:hypothetical protein